MNFETSLKATIDRSAVRRDYRRDEEQVVADRLAQARLPAGKDAEAEAIARSLVGHVRASKPAGLDAFLHAYDLGSDEGVALMCLAEALLRIPDARTADELIHDKLSGPDWSEKMGDSHSPFVNAATFSLLLTGKVLDGANDRSGNWKAALGRAVGRLGEPVIRTAVGQAMKILGGQFVFGRTIDEALERAAPERKRGLSHSFDMLGEAARTMADAERYAEAYRAALRRIAQEAKGGVVGSPGISVKLSALHPRYDHLRANEAKAHILPILRELCEIASVADIHLTIDAEEADRLELQMDILEELVRDDRFFVPRADGSSWTGLGMALQAYAKRAVPVAEWVVDLARAHRRTLMIRLVKGAYWDSEVKLAQVGGYDDYPVFTRKVATDVSYLACAKVLLGAPDCIYAAFATHNATSIGAIKALAATTPFEFQRLHGMGEGLYEGLAELEAHLGQPQTPVRIYAPVGSHKELLAYLVRRLLENGANSSFVNRIADEQVGLDELTRDPVAQLEAVSPRRNPKIPRPGEMFGTNRRNSSGCDLSDPGVREPLLARLRRLEGKRWTAGEGNGPRCEVRAPYDTRLIVGEAIEATPEQIDAMLQAASAAQPAWDALGGQHRARLLDRTADLFEQHREDFYSLCIREAGKTLADAILEVRKRSTSCAITRPKPAACSPAPSSCRDRPASSTNCACTAAAYGPAYRPGTSRWRSSPARSPQRLRPATRRSPSRPSRRRSLPHSPSTCSTAPACRTTLSSWRSATAMSGLHSWLTR